MLFLGRIYIARGFWHLGDFCNIFRPNVSEDQKKSYYLSAGPWRSGYCITFIKRLGESSIICSKRIGLWLQNCGCRFEVVNFRKIVSSNRMSLTLRIELGRV